MAVFSFTQLYKQLNSLRIQFGLEKSKEKLELLNCLKSVALPKSKSALLNYHELLLFIKSYPDNEPVLKSVADELSRLEINFREQLNCNKDTFLKKFHDSGVAYSTASLYPSLDAAEWLWYNCYHEIELVEDGELNSRIGSILQLLCINIEHDGLTDERYDAVDWIYEVTGDKNKNLLTVFSWVVKSIVGLRCDAAFKDYLMEKAGFNIQLNLSGKNWSRTNNFLPSKNIYWQKKEIHKHFNVIEIIKRKVSHIVRIKNHLAEQVINSAKFVMAARDRETDPITYGKQVLEIKTEHGLMIYLFNMQHEHKLPIENYTGFVAYRNGVPVGYGGGWIFFDRCEIGVNIFDTFRGGENAFIFTNILRAYYQVFGVSKFVVPPYQFGEDNYEGLKSGAYWFYYKLGFKSRSKQIAQMAEKEFSKIQRIHNYRSDIKTLKKFTESPLELCIKKPKTNLEPKHLGLAVSKWINSEFDGSKHEALVASKKYLNHHFSFAKKISFSPEEKFTFNNWALLLTCVDACKKMYMDEKRKLFQLIKLKSSDEITFSKMLKRQNKLLKAFESVAN